LDQDVVYWRRFAARNARGTNKEEVTADKGAASPDETGEYNTVREAL
jgi:hypothetical protein